MGRPAYAPTDRDIVKIMNMAAQGATKALICRQIGIDKKTLANNEAAQAAIEEGREIDEGLCHSRAGELMRQNDNLHVAEGMVKFRLAVVHKVVEPKAEPGAGGQGHFIDQIEAEEAAEAAVESARAKLAPYLAARTNIDHMGNTIANAVRTGAFDGDLSALKALIALLETPEAHEIEGEGVRYLPTPQLVTQEPETQTSVTEPGAPGKTDQNTPILAPTVASEPSKAAPITETDVETAPEQQFDDEGRPIKTIAEMMAEAKAALEGN